MQSHTGGGQSDGVRAALEELDPQLLLQALNVAAEHGLGQVKHFCRLPVVKDLGQGVKFEEPVSVQGSSSPFKARNDFKF